MATVSPVSTGPVTRLARSILPDVPDISDSEADPAVGAEATTLMVTVDDANTPFAPIAV